MDTSVRRPVVCDTGTGMIKAGLAGDSEPSLVMPNLVGRPMLRYESGYIDGQKISDLMIGDAANSARSMLQLSRPIGDGVVNNWDDMEAVWDHAFNRLNIVPSETRIVQTEAALNPKQNRERIAETMLEKFGFEGVNISIQAICALNSQGLTTGLVVDSGDGVTHIVPVAHGYLEPALVHRMNLAGRHVTDQLMKLLIGAGNPLNAMSDFETIREAKQRLCYVALDPVAERRFCSETTLVERQYTLPDSRTMRIGAERFLAPEILFNPALHGNTDAEGVVVNVFNTIRKSEIDLQRDYFGHIVLSGGTTMFPGFSSRMEKDLKAMYLERVLQGDRHRANKFRCHVEDPPRRQHMVFIGASIMAKSCTARPDYWLTKVEYEENGASAIHRLIPTRLS